MENSKNNDDNDYSPLTITIKAPPRIMGSLLFSARGADIKMTSHKLAKWSRLSALQTINWPHIEVKFTSTDLSFIRRQVPHFRRYLKLSTQPLGMHAMGGPPVEMTQPLKIEEPKQCFTARFVEKYMAEYIAALDTIEGVNRSKLSEIATILGQFLEDIHHMRVNDSICTNLMILFRYSNNFYYRDKTSNGGYPDFGDKIEFCEVLTPKVELAVEYFNAEQTQVKEREISFEYTEMIRSYQCASFMPSIVYRCTMCDIQFGSRKRVVQHLHDYHAMEVAVRCGACLKIFDVAKLARTRWTHNCTKNDDLICL